MDTLIQIFGEGKELSILQMISRGIIIFLITLGLLRISGRRSFGLRHPLDNIIAITLGSILSRAIVGASPFLPVVLTSLVVVSLHRILGWLILRNQRIERTIQGRKILLYADDKFLDKNMERALTSKEDVMESVREATHSEQLNNIATVYMERNGKITIIKKHEDH